MAGAPRNPAPRNNFLVWIVKPSGCHCTDAFDGKSYRRVPTPLRSTSPFSEGRSNSNSNSNSNGNSNSNAVVLGGLGDGGVEDDEAQHEGVHHLDEASLEPTNSIILR